jgi:hypothetical protein
LGASVDVTEGQRRGRPKTGNLDGPSRVIRASMKSV